MEDNKKEFDTATSEAVEDNAKTVAEDNMEETADMANGEAGAKEPQSEDNSAKESTAEESGEGQTDKNAKKDKKDLQIEELNDKYRRTMAEFDNFRKRTEKEKTAMYEIGAKDIVEKILPVIDNFERGFAMLTEEEKAAPFADGMDKVYKQFVKVLEDAGVTPIEAVGQEFNPDFHNAVMHVEDENLGENVVAEELQKGYMYRNSVVRHSMVKVAN